MNKLVFVFLAALFSCSPPGDNTTRRSASVITPGNAGTITAGGTTLTTNTLPRATGASSIGDSSITDDGTTITSAENITLTAPVGTVNVTPGALYVVGTIGIGDGGTGGAATPGTFLDVRHNWRAGWDDFELVEDGPNSANGVEIDYVRGYGDLSTHTSTSVGTEISHVAIWGYDTGNVGRQISRERWMVDRANNASSVQGAFDLWMADSTGQIRDTFRFDASHHISVMDTATPALTSCGTSPTIVGSDVSGTVTIGSAATGCTITFHYSWALTSGFVPVHCTVTSRSGINFTYSPVNATLTLTNGTGNLSSTLVDYTCLGA